MVDNSGPGNVSHCRTTGLVDLGDTEGFDAAGAERTIYGLNYQRECTRGKKYKHPKV